LFKKDKLTVEVAAATALTDFFSSEEVGVDWEVLEPLGGAAPFFTGVLGGKCLSIYSGEI
jgi:hypothetical protein